MTSGTPPLGLLLDVDGPVASPLNRSIAIPSITADLVALANSGVPIAFNTGRSAAFVRDSVVKPLLAAGLEPDARVYGICEKGAVWFGATMTWFDGVHVDEAVAVPPPIVDALHALLDDRYADTVFWDSPKHAMVSFEQRTDVDAATFAEARAHLVDDAFDLIAGYGVGVVVADIRGTGRRSGETLALRIEPTVISVDVESITLGKDLGAERALGLMRASGPLPTLWRTVGDSRSDYAMADLLHARGFEVAHVDVRPSEGVPEKPYRVITEGDLVNDAAGAAFLSHWVRELGLS